MLLTKHKLVKLLILIMWLVKKQTSLMIKIIKSMIMRYIIQLTINTITLKLSIIKLK